MTSHEPTVILQATWLRVASLLPTLGAALLTAIVGLLLAWAVHRLLALGIRKLRVDAALEKMGASRVLYGLGLRFGIDQLGARLGAAVVLVLTASAIMDILGLTYLSVGLAGLVAYLPQFLSGVVILVGGLILADLLRSIAVRLGKDRDDLAAPRMAGEIVYYVVLAVAVTLAAEQAGLDLELIHDLLLVGIGTAAAAFGLAFALAGQHSLRSLIARHYAERLYLPGDSLRVGDLQGVLVHYDTVTATLATDEGEVTLPCTLLLDQAVLVERVPVDGNAPR
ncbi:MAG: hypothetical protein D6798_13070 [Deltaproteobacteria bacterium]|nr:MAG: hypothetical protein D6798_13070 [Deltaproteobacteria bacterium]